MIVTIDGPAGAGKSSVSRQLAERIGAAFLDTGAFYRSATLAVMRAQATGGTEQEIANIVALSTIEMRGNQILLNGEDVSSKIRTPEVTSLIRVVADNFAARRTLSQAQRQFAKRNPYLVTEGRDQGTEVFPEAECKIFLTASDEERARRRWEQLRREGRSISLEQVLEDQRRRDSEDRARAMGGLKVATNAVTLLTDGLTESEVIDQLESIVLSCKQRLEAESTSCPESTVSLP